MTDVIISLKPTMTKRLDFDHPMFDLIPQGKEGKMGGTTAMSLLKEYNNTGSIAVRDQLLMGHMWLAKDLVCRFRAHWPQTLSMTADLASEGVLALTEFITERVKCVESPAHSVVDDACYVETPKQFFGKCQQFLHTRMRAYINDNRCTFGASKTTNERLLNKDQQLEYNYALEHNEELNGEKDFDPCYVDVLDSIEALADCDREEMQELILMFLQHDHDIAEADLSDAERAALDKLSKLGENLI